jgi:hypothetical protein
MPSPSSSRRLWLIVAPLVLLALLAAAWSALWVYAQGRVEAEIDRALARESGAGRNITCAERTVAGFPLRIEVSCAKPLFAQSRGRAIEVTGERLTAVAEVWQPRHVRFDILGPVRVAEPGPGGREIALAAFTAGRAVAVHDSDGRHQLQVTADDLELKLDEAARVFRSPHAEFTLHRQGADGAGSHPVDVTLAVARLDGPLALPGVHGAVDLTAQLTVSGVDGIRGATQAEQLRSWAAAGGKADIGHLRLMGEGIASDASGVVGLDARGRLNGSLRVLVHGLDQVMDDLVRRRAVPPEMMTLLPTLAAISRKGDIAGRPAMALPIALREGLIRVGPVPIGAIPPLF